MDTGGRSAFVGRREQLERLEAVLHDVRQGRPGVVLVEGEAGIGKSALVRHFARSHPDVDHRWVSGDENEVDLAFGLAAQLLGTSADALSASGDVLAVGARLLEAAGALGRGGPAIVVVDDLGWGDLATLQALAFALRRFVADPVLVCMSVRPEHVDRLPSSLRQLIDQRGLHLRLSGLGEDEVRELAAVMGHDTLPTAAIRRVTAHTQGNPLHLRTLLSEVQADALAAVTDSPLPAPDAVAALVTGRLATMAADAVALLEAAAVLGLRSSLAEAAHLAELSDPTLAVDAAVASELVEVMPTAGAISLAFTHPLVRAAVYHGVPIARRAGLHRAAAALLGGTAGLRHEAHATLGYDAELAARLIAAAEQQLMAPAGASAAAAWYQHAARLTADRAAREDLLMRALDALIVAGDASGAGVLAMAALGFESTPRKSFLEGNLALARGDFDGAQQLLLTAWDRVDAAEDPALAARIAGVLGTMCLNRASLDEAVAWAQVALRTNPVAAATTGADMLHPLALAANGDYDEALEVCRLPEGDLPQDPGAIHRLVGRGVVRLWVDDLKEAHDDLERAAAQAREAGVFVPYAAALYYLAEVEFRLGDWDDAVLHAQLVGSLADDADQRWFEALPHGTAALPLAARGEWEAATEHVERALRAAESVGDASSIMWAATAQASLALARGDHKAAAEAAESCLDHQGIGRVKELGVKPWRALGAEACAALGEIERGRRMLDGVQVRGRLGAEPITPLLWVARAEAKLADAAGDREAAERWFDEARSLAARCQSPFDVAQVHLAIGAHLRRRGSRKAAIEELRLAHQGFSGLRAAPWVERTDQELAACNARLGPRDDSRRVTLTAQEQAVVRLVQAGRRNREIAAELYISIKTVEYHLSSVYRKLGVRSRTELVHLLSEQAG